MENQYVCLLDAVDNDVLAHQKTAQPGTQILVTGPPDMGIAGKEIEPLRDGINKPVGNLDAAAFFRDVIPDVVELCLGLWCNTVSHQRGVDRSAARRLRPRFFTSSAICRMDSCVIAPFAACDGGLGHVNSGQNLRAATFALFPQGERFLDRVFLTVESATFNSLADKRFLIRCEVYFHTLLG
jgi:hypothetical protein